MQIKTTMRYHLTLVRMAIVKKSTNNKCCRECTKKLVGTKVGTATMENSMEVPLKAKNTLAM